MSIQRPVHLTNRQPRGRMFGEAATLITVHTRNNDFGEPVQAEVPAPITCATAPPSGQGQNPRVRQLAEAGVALEAMRMFWTVETPRPVATIQPATSSSSRANGSGCTASRRGAGSASASA